MKTSQKILYLKMITPKELQIKWNILLPNNWIYEDYLFISCSSAGKVNYDKCEVYKADEIKRKIIKIY